MKEDIPWNHQDGLLPILDTKMGVENGLVVHHHFTKSMASLEVVLSRSAMSLGSKLSILVQEGCRIIRNCSPDLQWQHKLDYLNKLMVRIKWSGYGFKVREIVAKRILAKTDNDRRNYEELGRPLYRDKLTRAQVVKSDKSTWFRSEGATTTLTVPVTEGSILAKRLREVVARVQGPRGTSVRVVERPGPPLLSGLALSNPFPMTVCPKPNCPLELSGTTCRGRCSTESVVYKATCVLCEEEQEALGVPESQRIQYQYVGETSRTVRIRSGQHKADYLKCSREGRQASVEEDTWSSFMWDHRLAKHHNNTTMDPDRDFKFDILSSFKDPMTRQITEAVFINQALETNTQTDKKGVEIPVHSLNRKFECFAPRDRNFNSNNS